MNKGISSGKFKCRGCGREFEKYEPGFAFCDCGSNMIDWLNYDEVRRSWSCKHGIPHWFNCKKCT